MHGITISLRLPTQSTDWGDRTSRGQLVQTPFAAWCGRHWCIWQSNSAQQWWPCMNIFSAWSCLELLFLGHFFASCDILLQLFYVFLTSFWKSFLYRCKDITNGYKWCFDCSTLVDLWGSCAYWWTCGSRKSHDWHHRFAPQSSSWASLSSPPFGKGLAGQNRSNLARDCKTGSLFWYCLCSWTVTVKMHIPWSIVPVHCVARHLWNIMEYLYFTYIYTSIPLSIQTVNHHMSEMWVLDSSRKLMPRRTSTKCESWTA